jgi:hypothetical protein
MIKKGMTNCFHIFVNAIRNKLNTEVCLSKDREGI